MKPTKFWIILFSVLLAVSAAGSYLVLRGRTGTVAEIYSGGELIDSIELSQITEGYSFTVTGPDGGENTINVEPGRIRVSQADCPDRVCVHQGWIETGVIPIVCLPNELVIRITGADGDIDGVSG